MSRRPSIASVTDSGLSRRSSVLDATTIDLPEIQLEQLNVFTEIGQGRFKTVSSGCYYRRGNVAILRYKPNYNANEVQILAHLSKHDVKAHTVETYGFLRDAGTLVVVQEMATFGSVRSVLQDSELVSMVTPLHKLHMAAQFAQAVSFLASMRVIHTDLACRNFLVFSLDDEPKHTIVKLTDFTSSLIIAPQSDRLRRKLPQASRWCAPETVTFNEWGYQTEVWSLGITLWELLSGGVTPWTNFSKRSEVVQKLKELAWSVNDGNAPADSIMALDFPLPQTGIISSSAQATLLSCLRPDASARPSSKQIELLFEQIVEPSPALMAPSDVEAHPSPRNSPVKLPTSAQRQNSDRTRANIIVHPVVRSSTPAKELFDSGASDFRAESTIQTPSTACPTALSTPRPTTVSRSGSSFSGYPPSGSVFSYERYATPESTSRSSSSMSSENVSLQRFQRALWYSPTWPKKAESLSNIRAFLSCPEAVCGLGIQTQTLFRGELAAAEAARHQMATSTLIL